MAAGAGAATGATTGTTTGATGAATEATVGAAVVAFLVVRLVAGAAEDIFLMLLVEEVLRGYKRGNACCHTFFGCLNFVRRRRENVTFFLVRSFIPRGFLT
jgi:ADP-ribosylglycohydrolase